MQKYGDFVAYTPDKGSINHTEKEPTTGETYTSLIGGGYATFSTEQFNWRILDIDEENDKLTITSDGVTKNSIVLNGAQGYNNGVGVLNLIGQRCYSNQKLNAVGRSINLDDINKLLTTSIYEFRNLTLNMRAGRLVPSVHAMEEYSNMNGELLLPGSQCAPGEKAWKNNEQKRFIKSVSVNDLPIGLTTATNGVKSLAFEKSYFNSTVEPSEISYKSTLIRDLINKKSSENGYLAYALASRYCRGSTDGTIGSFGVFFYLSGAIRTTGYLFLSTNSTENTGEYNIRPAVDIPLSGTILGTSRKWTYKYSMDIITRLRNKESSKVKIELSLK